MQTISGCRRVRTGPYVVFLLKVNTGWHLFVYIFIVVCEITFSSNVHICNLKPRSQRGPKIIKERNEKKLK